MKLGPLLKRVRKSAGLTLRRMPLPAAPAPSVISFTGHADMPIEAIEVGPSFETPLPISECEELREDAERYRWLRENCGYSGSGPHNGVQVIVYYADAGDGKHGIAYTGPRQRVGIMALDDAIDAAMKEAE